jgi:hypothetical protein
MERKTDGGEVHMSEPKNHSPVEMFGREGGRFGQGCKGQHASIPHTPSVPRRGNSRTYLYSGKRRWLKHVCAVGSRSESGPFLLMMKVILLAREPHNSRRQKPRRQRTVR